MSPSYSSDEFNRTIQAEIQETRAVVEETKAVIYDAHSTVTSTVTGVAAPVLVAPPVDAQAPEPVEARAGPARDEILPPY